MLNRNPTVYFTVVALVASLATGGGVMAAEVVPHSIAGVRIADIAGGDKMITQKVYLKASPERVFAYMIDFARMPEWMPSIKSLTVDNRHSNNGPSAVGLGTHRYCTMTGAKCTETVVHFDQPNAFAYRIVDSQGLAFPLAEGTGFVTTQPASDGGTIMTYRVIYQTKSLHPAGLMAPMMLKKQLGDGLDRIAQKFGGRRID